MNAKIAIKYQSFANNVKHALDLYLKPITTSKKKREMSSKISKCKSKDDIDRLVKNKWMSKQKKELHLSIIFDTRKIIEQMRCQLKRIFDCHSECIEIKTEYFIHNFLLFNACKNSQIFNKKPWKQRNQFKYLR